jgi:hypothetical protein
MTPVDAKTETFTERHSWKVLLGTNIIFALFGLGDIIQGMNADPAIANSLTGVAWEEIRRSNPALANLIDLQVRSGGAQLFTLASLSVLVCVLGYRRGARWSWYAMWLWPLLMVFIFLVFVTADRQPDIPPPPPMISAPVFFIIFVLGLLLPYRKFFPKQP